MLVRKNGKQKDFVDQMNKLYQSYASKAKNELRKISTHSEAKHHLENLTDLTSVQF
jgi:geranylgeranyl pyrophosphate synthase